MRASKGMDKAGFKCFTRICQALEPLLATYRGESKIDPVLKIYLCWYTRTQSTCMDCGKYVKSYSSFLPRLSGPGALGPQTPK